MPGFSKASLIPAQPEELEKLQALSQLELPAEYVSFAVLMGKDSGEVLSDFLGSLSIDAAIEFYEDETVQEFADKHLVIGVGTMDCYQELAISLSEDSYGKIFDIDENEIIAPIADSLFKLIYQQVFFKYELKRPYNILDLSLKSGQAKLKAAFKVFEQYGFSICDFSDNYNVYGRKKEMRYGAHQVNDGSGWMRIAGENEEQLLELKSYITERF